MSITFLKENSHLTISIQFQSYAKDCKILISFGFMQTLRKAICVRKIE